MELSADAKTYLAHFEHWDPEVPTMRGLWERISPAEREEIREALREQMHARNADRAETILRDLPKKWRDVVIERVKDRRGPVVTKYQAFREAHQRWATHGITPTDRVALVTLRRKNIVNRCEVGWYLRGDCVPVVAGSGSTWEEAFADADARACKLETSLKALPPRDVELLLEET